MIHKHKIRAAVLAAFLGTMYAWSASAETPACEIVESKDIPAEAIQIDTGVITATQSSWSKSFSAGQAAWVVLENGNVHLTPVVVRFTETEVDPQTGRRSHRTACESLVTVPLRGAVVVKRSVFGTRISYNVEVELPNEPPIDSALVRIVIRARPPQ